MDPLSKINILDADLQAIQPKSPPVPKESLDFNKVFKESITEVNGLDTQAKRMVEALATGETNDVSGVMLAVRKADLAFMSILQIRNQMVDAYQEIMRMRV